jgi:hypothetical protein
MGLGSTLRMESTKRVQVITDIDDTVKSSGGLRLLGKLGVNIGPALGGLDTQYKRNDFYPGVFQFGAELASYGLPPNMQPAPMAVLTARARELKAFLALKPSTKLVTNYMDAAEKLFNKFGKGSATWGIDTEKTVLYGSVIEWILQVGWACQQRVRPRLQIQTFLLLIVLIPLVLRKISVDLLYNV